jgi:hypothetical protein
MKKQAKVHKVMSEFKAGTLRTGTGQRVVNRKQAIAIAISEAEEVKNRIKGRVKR